MILVPGHALAADLVAADQAPAEVENELGGIFLSVHDHVRLVPANPFSNERIATDGDRDSFLIAKLDLAFAVAH